MSFKYGISTLALAAALLASPPAFAQLGISVGGDDGVNVGVDVDTDDGLDVGADANVGGDDGIDAGADIGAGGNDGIDVGAEVDVGGNSDDDDDNGRSLLDAELGIGSGDNDDADSNGLVDLDVGVGDDDSLVNLGGTDVEPSTTTGNLVDADVDVGGQTVGGSNLLGLGEQARGDALIDLVGDNGIGDVDLDNLVDDQRVIIVDIGENFSDATLAEIDVVLGSGEASGTDDTRAAIAASVELSSVLSNNDLSAEDVLALQIGSEGETYVYVQPSFDDGIGLLADVDAAGEDVADADISALDGEAIADADVDILRGSGGDDASLVDLDAGIGEDATESEGDPAAVDVDADIGLGDTDLAQTDLEIIGEDALVSGDLIILPGSGEDNGEDDMPGNGDDGDAPGDGDGDGDDMPGNDEDDTPDEGNGDGDMPGGGSNDDGDDTVGNGGGNAGGTGGGTAGTTMPTDDMAGAMVSTMQCPADIRAFLEATTDAQSVRSATEAEIVLLTDCPTGGLFDSADFSPLRALLAALPVTQQAIASADITIDDVVSATVSGDVVTIYAID